jgi:asparagine synthase (glutamine-hydrolysing)
MCGICGVVGLSEKEAIKRMVQSLTHRGPDDSGVEILESGRAVFGHTRLSILDLSALGHQPMMDDEGRFCITYNGEIYNYRELRDALSTRGHNFRSNSDTEVILYAYKQWGAECLNKLNGMFAFALWDKDSGRLFAARDRLGIKPFYYWHDKAQFVFASEIKALFESGLVRPEIDYDALHTPAMYQVAPRTGFRNVYKLLPGHYLTVEGTALYTQRYWNIDPSCEVADLTAATNALDGLVQDTVKMQMISDVPIGLLLSGGLDSSLLLALMARNTSEQVNTFTVTFATRDQRHERMPDDGKYARNVAMLFRSRHREIQIEPDIVDLLPRMMWHMDEPLSDPAAINTFLLCRTARDHGVSVVLNGMGADEICGGYRKYLACLLASQYQAYVPEIGQRLIRRVVDSLPAATSQRGLRTVRWAKRFLSFASLPETARFTASAAMPASAFAGLFTRSPANGKRFDETYFARTQRATLERENLPYLVRMCLADTSSYITDHNLLYSDKASMAASVESRPPFTDHRIVEYMFSTHPDLRIRGLQQKVLLKKVAERYLPRSVVHRPKAPFGAPLRAWIRGPLSQMIGDYLCSDSLKARGLYNAEYVWKKIENDRTGLEDNAHLIWTLLCNEIWFRTFFSKPL